VFVLIGLQLHYVLSNIRDHQLGTLIEYGALFSAFLILVRLIWNFPGAYLANLIRRRILHQRDPMPGVRQIFVVGWTGMRGVISLAAAIALPQTFENGTPFTQRSMIIFLAFSAILVTLVLQGLTLPTLIRVLGLAGASASHSTEEEEARRTILKAALQYLEEVRENAKPELAEVYDDLSQHYRARLASLNEDNSADGLAEAMSYNQYVELSRKLLKIERQTAVQLRNGRRISDELLRELEDELDLSESKFAERS
jgi:NhaP-type Na+/H+ or K+/H+ antiporter